MHSLRRSVENLLKSNEFYKEMSHLLEPNGVSLVEARHIVTKGGGNVVSLYVTKDDVLNTDTLEEVYNLVFLYLKGKFQKLTLEVSTPGSTRNIKDAGEFEFFKNRPVRLYVDEFSSWVNGVIGEVGNASLKLQNCVNEDTKENLGEREISFYSIKKARLIDSFLKEKESNAK